MIKYYKIIIFIAIAFMVIVSVRLAKDDALIFDELSHISAGYSYVSELDYRLNPEHPPLVKILSGFFLLPLKLNFNTDLDFWSKFSGSQEYDQWMAGYYFLHQADNDVDRITFFARLPVVLISIILALLLFKWGRKRGGITTGIFAFLLFVFDPNILGHNHLVTTDIAIAFGVSLAFYFLSDFLKNPTWKNVILFGIVLGIAQVIKFSAFLLIPFLFFFGVVFIIFKLSETKKYQFRIVLQYLVKIVASLIVAFFVIWVVYVPFTWNMPVSVLKNVAPHQIHVDDGLIDKSGLEFILWVNEYSFTRPLGMYALGLAQVKNRVKYGNGVYFMGKVSDSAFITYFPVVFVSKQTVFHLLFYCIAGIILLKYLFCGLYRAFSQKIMDTLISVRKIFFDNLTEISVGLFVICYIVISVLGNLNIGFRHLFLIMPLLYFITARVCVSAYNKLVKRKKKSIVQYFFWGVIGLMIIEVILAFPFYISYFNQFVGGSKNGYKIVTDSNADWGQDLKRLKKYLEQHPEIDKIHVDYFGGGYPQSRLGDKFIGWNESRRPIESGYYAISVNVLQGSIYDANKSNDNSYRWILKYQLIDQVGSSILIYKVD